MNQGSLEKWLILGLQQEIYNVSLEYHAVPKTKKVLTHTHMEGVCQRDRIKLKEIPVAKAGTIFLT